MRMMPLILALVAAPTAQAETILSPEEFHAYSAGTTLYFNRGGQAYGAEQYFDDRKVIWTFFNGNCQRGFWYQAGQEICFVYEIDPEAQCWHFLDTGKGRAARRIGDDPADDLIVAGQDDVPLSCPGPDLGVSYQPSSDFSSPNRLP